MPTPNAALARRVLEHIETHPAEWDQKFFATRSDCGTAYCFAGWTVKLEFPNAEPVFLKPWYPLTGSVRTQPGGEIEQFDELAGQLLRLTSGEYWVLFDERNTLDDLRHIVGQLESASYDGVLTAPDRYLEDEDA